MNLIFSADQNWGIGRNNRLLYHIPGDMAYFKKMTTGKTVIMGRKTLESLPGGRPLPNRENIVLTRSANFYSTDVLVCHSLDELFTLIADKNAEDIFIIGGEQIYRQLMPYSKTAYITRWDTVSDADSFVPNFDHADGWQMTEQSKLQEEKGIAYRFFVYTQKKPKEYH